MAYWIHGKWVLMVISMVVGMTTVAIGVRAAKLRRQGMPIETPTWMTLCTVLVLAAAVVVMAVH